MKYHVLIFAIFLIPVFHLVSAEVWIPETEFAGYFGADNIYTVVGVVKNTEDYAVLPTITVTVYEGDKINSIIQQLPPVFSNKDIPFKIKFPQVTNPTVALEKPIVTFKKTSVQQPTVEVIYDKSLKKHEDGHQSGRIINYGNKTMHNIKVYATIHGSDNKFIDVGKSIETIEKIEPGQITEFTIYPDPSLASQVNYYSCFAIGDPTIVPLYAIRDGERFEFRYDSTASFTVVGFDKTGTKLTLEGINSFKLPTYVNFEFPSTSDSEKFDVTINEKPVRFIQSKDEMGNWHVAFDIEPASQYEIVINGFEKPRSEIVSSEPQKASQIVPNNEFVLLYVVVAVVTSSIVGAFLYRRRKVTV